MARRERVHSLADTPGVKAPKSLMGSPKALLHGGCLVEQPFPGSFPGRLSETGSALLRSGALLGTWSTRGRGDLRKELWRMHGADTLVFTLGAGQGQAGEEATGTCTPSQPRPRSCRETAPIGTLPFILTAVDFIPESLDTPSLSNLPSRRKGRPSRAASRQRRRSYCA